MDKNELWIGDFLRIKQSGRIGRFAGLKDGKVLLNLDGDKKLFSADELVLTDDPIEENAELPVDEQINEEAFSFKGKSIDLHIEKLNINMVDALPERIRDYQIEQCKRFIAYAINKRYASVEIIHGKGTGLLKQEIQHILKLEQAVQFFLEKNQGGATEVWFDPNAFFTS